MTRPLLTHTLETMADLAARPAKYGNKRVEIDGHKFASKKEGRRYTELRLLERAGEISGLKLQPRFPLRVFGKLICTYVADFQYLEKDGRVVVEDAKGFRTREYINKAKLFEAVIGFPIREV